MGDDFLDSISGTYETLSTEYRKDKKLAPLYIDDYYNEKFFTRLVSSGVRQIIARTLNSLNEALRGERLPRFIISVVDKDVMRDNDILDKSTHQEIPDMIHWLVKRMDQLTRKKKLALIKKKARSVYSGDPIFNSYLHDEAFWVS